MTRLLKTSKIKSPKARTSSKTNRIRLLLRDGLIHKSKGNHERAIRCLDQVLRIEPENADALYVKCNVFFETKQYSKALHVLDRCRRSKPANPQLNYIVGYHYHQLKRYDKAVESLTVALRVNPDFMPARMLLVNIYIAIGQRRTARLIFDEIKESQISETKEALSLASLCIDLKLFDRALKQLEKHLEEAEFFTDICGLLLRIPGKYPKSIAFARIPLHLADNKIPAIDQSRLHFAAGRIAESDGRFDEAFDHFKTANDLSVGKFDLDQMAEMVSFMTDAFSPDFDFRPYGPYMKDIVPVFIVGMPRTGKTTLEQELLRHPDVAASDERDLRMYIDDDIFVRLECETPKSLKTRVGEFPTQLRKHYAKTYLDQVLSSLYLQEKPRLLLNTMPMNYQNAGVLRMIFPNAMFINLKRDPVDTCWFCFSKNFLNEYYFADKLDVLGKYYGNYQRLARHWKNVMPTQWLDINYEQLVADPQETVARVLEFLRARDVSLESSSAVVGEGVSTEYIGYWRNYEKHLKPLVYSLAE